MAATLLLSSLGCSRSDAGAPNEGWVTHKDPLGFEVSHPPKWAVETNSEGRIVVRSADTSAFVVIQPFLLHADMSAMGWIQQAPEWFSSLFPNARLGRSESRGGKVDEAVAALTYDAKSGKGRATLLCSLYRRSGMFYAIAAPEAQFEAKKQALVRILESFSFTQPSAAGVEFEKWTDPKEGAFSLEVPKGWKVTGGQFRFGPLDARPQIDAVSPDGKIRIRCGDTTLMTYSEPTALGDIQGYREGMTISVEGAYQAKIMRYFPGLAFVKDYVKHRIAPDYTDFAFAQERNRADVARQVGPAYERAYSLAGQVAVDAGDVAFTCASQAGRMRGGFFTLTFRIKGANVSLWWAHQLYGYVATESEAKRARAILGRMVATVRLNPAWVEAQARLGNQVVRTTCRLMEETSRALSAVTRSWQASSDNIARKWSNELGGLTDVMDPDTGETWRVSSGRNYYWHQPATGAVVGTDTFDRPDIDFRLLREW